MKHLQRMQVNPVRTLESIDEGRGTMMLSSSWRNNGAWALWAEVWSRAWDLNILSRKRRCEVVWIFSNDWVPTIMESHR